MAIGSDNTIKVYLEGAASNIDITERVASIDAKKRLNQFDYVDVSVLAIDGITSSLLEPGTALKVMLGSDLFTCCSIEEPKKNMGFSAKIKGYERTGTESSGRQLLTEVADSGRRLFDFQLSDILDISADPYGILRDQSGNVVLDLSFSGTDPYLRPRFSGQPTPRALYDLMLMAGKEFYVKHGTNSSSPEYNDDDIVVKDTVGDTSPVKTYYLTGNNQNCKLVSNNTERASAINRIIAQGFDFNSVSIETDVHYSTTDMTKLSSAMDSWLEEDLSRTGTTIYVYDSTPFGTTGTIKIGDEEITYTGKSSSPHSLTGATRGANGTDATSHSKKTDVVYLFKDSSGTAQGSISVDSSSDFASSGTIRIGSEEITYTSKPSGTTIGGTITRGANSTTAYSHGDGTRVFRYDSGHTIDNPESGSSIDSYGVQSKSLNVNIAGTRDDLDKFAQTVGDAMRDLVNRITIEVGNPYDLGHFDDDGGGAVAHIVCGNYVTINNATDVGISDGDYRVIGIDLAYNYGVPSVLLHLNAADSSKRAFVKSGMLDFVEEFSLNNRIDNNIPVKNLSDKTNKLFDFIKLANSDNDLVIESPDDILQYAKDDFILIGGGGFDIANASTVSPMTITSADDTNIYGYGDVTIRSGYEDTLGKNTSGSNDVHIRLPTETLDNDTDNPDSYFDVEDNSGSSLLRVHADNTTGGDSYIRGYVNVKFDEDVEIDGGVEVGSPTGGNKGNGTINAEAVYDDNSLLSDFVFEDDYKLVPIDSLEIYCKENKSLPTMISEAEWKKEKPPLGVLVNQLWETVEAQTLYIIELNRRLKEIENKGTDS